MEDRIPIPTPRYTYPFTQVELDEAVKTWGCNCGPAALSFATQRKLDEVKLAIPGFLSKGYTNPTMMEEGLRALDLGFGNVPLHSVGQHTPFPQPGEFIQVLSQMISLVRIQFTGPWTHKRLARWAYQHTHWICAWLTPPLANPDGSHVLIFDINGRHMREPFPTLINRMEVWESEILPQLASGQERDGGWYPTHVWRIKK